MTEADNSVAVVCVPMFNGACILELVLTLTIQYPAPSPLVGDGFALTLLRVVCSALLCFCSRRLYYLWKCSYARHMKARATAIQ